MGVEFTFFFSKIFFILDWKNRNTLNLDGNTAVAIKRKNNSRPLYMKAVGYKGHLGCIEILKAKAAIMFDRVCMNKAQEEVESQRKGGGKGNNERPGYRLLLLLPVILQLDW